MIELTTTKFDAEISEAVTYQESLEKNSGTIKRASSLFDDILDFMESQTDEKILQNAADISSFMASSTEQLQ